MKRRPVVILVFALACGGLSAHLARRYLQAQLGSAPSSERPTTKVAVAAHDLPSGSVLRSADVKLIDWPAEMRPPGYVDGGSSLIGRELVFPMKANEPILASKLSGSAVGGLSAVIPAGMRAVSVKVDEVIAVGGFVVPGTRVDVLVTMPSEGDRPSNTRIVLQNIKVVAAGQTYESSEQAKPQETSVITLLVTPEQAEVLTLSSTEGQVQLALRNALDESRAATPGALADGIERQAPTPTPLARAAAPPVARERTQEAAVEIYHGSARTVSSF
jgi:pilus assembly protein CpaB